MIEMEDIPITKEEYTTMVKTINQLRKEKQHLIDKACEWLKHNFNMPDDFEIHFRKAMEE